MKRRWKSDGDGDWSLERMDASDSIAAAPAAFGERNGGAKCVREALYVPRGRETDRKLAMEFEFSCLFNELYIPLNLFQLH